MIIKNNDPTVEPSFSLSNRIMRQIWNIFWLLLFLPSPRPFHFWRSFMLRVFGAKIGKNVHVYPSVKIWAPWNLIVGDNVGIADGVILYCMDKIEIGSYSVVSQGAHLCGGSHDFNSKNFQLIAAKIVIESHVWICAGAFVAMGVTVPTGAVIGAHSVVTRSLNDQWSVYAGNPAKKINGRQRND